MKNIYASLYLTFAISFSVIAQTPLPYNTGFDSNSEQSGWQSFRYGQNQNPSYQWAFDPDTTLSPPFSLAHYYPVGGMTRTIDWMVSPEFSMPHGGKIDSLYYKFAGFGVPDTNDTVALYAVYGNADPALADSIELIHDFRGGDYNADRNWRDSSYSITAATGPVHIGFKYSTINNWLDTWFDNLYVSANPGPPAATKDIFMAELVIFPNPLRTGKLWVEGIDIKDVKVLSLNGALVKTIEVNNGLADLSDIPRGIYLIELNTGANTISRRLLIE